MSTTKILITNIIVILVIIIGGFTGYYFYNQSTLYFQTSNAQVTGQQIPIVAPAVGTLNNWTAKVGATMKAGTVIGSIAQPSAKGTTNVDITMPTDGTIVQTNAVNNETTVPGDPLAYAYDMKNLWVTANVDETVLSDIKVGQTVDVYVDALPNATLTGTVSQIGLTTANTFSLLPQSNSTANFTKVTQVIPVTITLNAAQGVGLVPGMSAEVRIHK